MNKIQSKILHDLRYRSFLGYNELWNKQSDSSKFAYHLRQLEKKRFVEKSDKGYCLTLEGIKFSDYLSFKAPQPISVVIVIAKDKNKVLVKEREKYPFKGYWEFCASKIKQNESFEEAAKDRLKTKIGLDGSVKYKGIEFLQTKEKGKLVMHHHLHIFLAENLHGTPKGGKWVKIKNFSPKKPLPHIEQTLKIALHNGFTIATSDLIKKGEKFTKYITHSFKKFSET